MCTLCVGAYGSLIKPGSFFMEIPDQRGSSTKQFIWLCCNWINLNFCYIFSKFGSIVSSHLILFHFPPNLITGISPPALHGFPVRALLSFPVWYISDPYKTKRWPVNKFRMGSLSGDLEIIILTVLITTLLMQLFRPTLYRILQCYWSVS